MRLILSCLAISFSLLCSGQYLVEANYLSSSTSSQLNIIPGLITQFDIDFYKIIYNTTGADGEPTIASGAFSKPSSETCSDFPMVIYQHGTTLNKENVPSRDNGEAAVNKVLGALGYYSLAPDYIGMGDSPGLHPYVHGLTEATAGVDMIRAVREFLATIGESDNGEVFITGYSQGGHAAMAMHKYIEDNELLAEFDVKGSAPASGPYNLSGSQTITLLSGEPYSNPGYIVYVGAAYDLVYGDIYDSYSDILQSPYDEIVVPFFDGDNTTMSMGDLNPQLPQVITDLLTPEYYASFESDLQHPLRVALADNDNYDWAPQRPVRMFYCTLDEQVAFTNSTSTLETMIANGAVDVQAQNMGPFTHGGCFGPAMIGAVSFFASVRTECLPVGLNELSLNITVSPNPVSEILTIDSDDPIMSYRIFDSAGRVVHRSNTKKSANWNQKRIDVSALSKGFYSLELRMGNKTTLQKVFIKN